METGRRGRGGGVATQLEDALSRLPIRALECRTVVRLVATSVVLGYQLTNEVVQLVTQSIEESGLAPFASIEIDGAFLDAVIGVPRVDALRSLVERIALKALENPLSDLEIEVERNPFEEGPPRIRIEITELLPLPTLKRIPWSVGPVHKVELEVLLGDAREVLENAWRVARALARKAGEVQRRRLRELPNAILSHLRLRHCYRVSHRVELGIEVGNPPRPLLTAALLGDRGEVLRLLEEGKDSPESFVRFEDWGETEWELEIESPARVFENLPSYIAVLNSLAQALESWGLLQSDLRMGLCLDERCEEEARSLGEALYRLRQNKELFLTISVGGTRIPIAKVCPDHGELPRVELLAMRKRVGDVWRSKLLA